MAEYIDPTYDVRFKLILGREDVSPELLIDFFNSLFEDYPDLRDIVSLKYLNNERLHERHDGKGIRYNLLVRLHVATDSSLRCRRMSNDISIIEQYITCQEQFQNKDSVAKMNWVRNDIMS